MQRALLTLVSFTAVALLSDAVVTLRGRVTSLEAERHADPARVAALEERVAGLVDGLTLARAELQDVRTELANDPERAALVDSVDELQRLLAENDRELEHYADQLDAWRADWAGREPAVFERSISELRSALEARWSQLDRIAAETARVANEGRERLDEINRELEPLKDTKDEDRMWTDLMGPVVQLAGDATVGSGVLLESRRVPDTDEWVTYMVTSWHVVRDIYGSPENVSNPIPVKRYLPDGTAVVDPAYMVTYDVSLDAALLELGTTERIPFGARLASRARLDEVKVFDEVYAVGCPLGNDPIPTSGEVAAVDHRVEGASYWMISAPTYIGNSGGGIFDGESHELLGIFSKIYTHGAMRSTIVPHMGLVTPLEQVYDWLDASGYARFESPDTVFEQQAEVASAGH